MIYTFWYFQEQSVCDLQVSSSSSNLKLNESDKDKKDCKKEKKDKSKNKKSLTSKSFLKSSASKSSLKSTISGTIPISTLPEYSLDQELAEKSNCGEQLELPTDMSDSTDSDKEKMEYINDSECDSLHSGKMLVHTILPISTY